MNQEKFEQAVRDLIHETWKIRDFDRDAVVIVIDAESERFVHASRGFSINATTNERTIYGYKFRTIWFLEPLSEIVPVDRNTIPEPVSTEPMKFCLYIEFKKRNGRIEYIDSPLCDEVYK